MHVIVSTAYCNDSRRIIVQSSPYPLRTIIAISKQTSLERVVIIHASASVIDMARETKSGPGLLKLPAELRNKIYDLVLNGADEETLCPFILQCSPGKRRYGYSLTQVCHQVRHETLTMWHAGKKLLLAMRADNMKHYITWLQRRPKAVFDSLRRIELEDYQHSTRSSPAHHPYFCKSAIIVNLTKISPVSWRRDRRCLCCPLMTVLLIESTPWLVL